MARDTWFETVADAQQRAKKRLPKSVYSALIAGSEKGVTVADNVEAFGELGFAPHVVGALEKRDLVDNRDGTGDLAAGDHLADRRAGGAPRRRGRGRAGRRRARHRDGAVLVRQQADRGGRRRQPADFFQIYWLGSRDEIAARVERARGRRAPSA